MFFGANKNSPAYKFYCQSFSKLKDYNIEYELDEKKYLIDITNLFFYILVIIKNLT